MTERRWLLRWRPSRPGRGEFSECRSESTAERTSPNFAARCLQIVRDVGIVAGLLVALLALWRTIEPTSADILVHIERATPGQLRAYATNTGTAAGTLLLDARLQADGGVSCSVRFVDLGDGHAIAPGSMAQFRIGSVPENRCPDTGRLANCRLTYWFIQAVGDREEETVPYPCGD